MFSVENPSVSAGAPKVPDGQQGRQCTELKRDGVRCKVNAVAGSQLCFFHDPAAAKERTAARARGGAKNRAAVLPRDTPDFPLTNAAEASALLARTINQLLRGELDPKVANGVGYLVTIMMKAMEAGKLEARVSALEAALNTKVPARNLLDTDDDLDNRGAGGEALKILAEPYPLGADDAAAVETAIYHHVHPWELFLTNDIHEWLPEDPAAGNDAGRALEQALRGLIADGEVKGGAAVALGSMPFEALLLAPLVDRQWIDRHLVKLAEFGAAVEESGLESRATAGHFLAPLQIYERVAGGQLVPADEELIALVRRQSKAALAKFAGHTKNIDGRIYLHIDDYRGWDGRKLQGDLPLQEGIVASSWNDWVDRHGGEGKAELGGIKVRKLRALAERSDFSVCSSPDK